ncbi:Spy/CpxP family protein refolding chaperone [Polaribacter porphyrae]|uniref:Periplasmic heavy metal sensor n=1 Tax=Polaribacter porphyrae TaxID=1137780 RepID=A0A2S7WMP2_9FLAO|nr:hypothetical protein [Polaribacter porphyrae]PQJ78870.1 hypothetical protein BTO18_06585 [Polaribacter porphyrae]
MKSKLLPITLLFLILLNGVLIFILLKKPHEKLKPNHTQRNFLTEKLQFSEIQEEKFLELDRQHKTKMEQIDHKIRNQKDILFNSFGKQINIDSLASITGKLEMQKDVEVFKFFSKVRNICKPEQLKKFDEIINKAIKGGKQRPPRDHKMPPPPR